MLIKLRARTTQPLVIIIFAEFYEDFFFLVGFLPTNYQFASSRKGGSPGRGFRGCLLASCVVCSFPARTLALRPRECRVLFFSPDCPGSCAEEQQGNGPVGLEQLNMNLYLGQDFRKPRYSFCRL